MSVSVVVPWRPDGAERNRNWAWLKARYRRFYPDWEIVVGTDPGPGWHKGVAVNAAVEASTGEVLVIADADVAVPDEALTTAVERLSTWVVPYRAVWRLNEVATLAWIAGTLRKPLDGDWFDRPPKRGAAGGGIVVVSRDHFDRVGGIDPRFEGWGGEDISFGRVLDTLVGRHVRLGFVAWHLWHEPLPMRPGRRGSAETEELAGRYRRAAGCPAEMRELLAEGAMCQ